MTTPSFQRLIETLNRHGVEFIVVGGVAAVLHGAPVTTFDLDALFRVGENNARRLLAALEELNARYRGHTPPLRPTLKDVLAGGHLLLATDAGPLDMLGFIGDRERFEDFAGSIVRIDAEGLQVPILGLADLIRVKRALSRDKDLPALRLLEALAQGRQS
jgi:predicted nucleotidyltransferase